jgi:hypothetical protein
MISNVIATEGLNREQVRVAELDALSRDEVREVLRLILENKQSEIAKIRSSLSVTCSDGICPHMIKDPATGEMRKVTPYDKIDPCDNLHCLAGQVTTWHDKFARWVRNDKWSGTIDGSDAQMDKETQDIPKKGYVDLILRVESTLGDAINNVKQSVESYAFANAAADSAVADSAVADSAAARAFAKFTGLFKRGDAANASDISRGRMVIIVVAIIIFIIIILSVVLSAGAKGANDTNELFSNEPPEYRHLRANSWLNRRYSV